MKSALLIKATPLNKEAFAPYGAVVEKAGSENFTINNGNCVRHHNLATTEISGDGGAVGISIFTGQPYQLPVSLSMVERHPLGSQAFYPLGAQPWLVIVCEDEDGVPVNPAAFYATSDQGINLNKGVWHGVLTPLGSVSDFLVVDRVGEGDNLVEHFFDEPFQVTI